MSKNFEQLTKDLQSDAALLKEFKDAKLSYADVDGIIAFAAKKGYTVTAGEIKNFAESIKNGKELSAEELEKVAGGWDSDESDLETAVCSLYIAVNLWVD